MLKKNFGLPGYFEVQRFCFARIGIDVTAEKHIVTNYYLNLIPQLCATTLCVSIAAYSFQHLDDAEDVTFPFAAVLQLLLGICKWATFMYGRREIVKLVRRILAWNEEAVEVERALIIAENRKDIRLCRLYIRLYFFSVTMAIAMPFLSFLWKYFQGVNVHIEPPINAIYLIDYRKPLNYLLVDTFMAIGIYGLSCISVGVDALFSWFTRNIVAHFRILQLRLERAGNENDGNVSTETLESCIRYHCRIIETVEALNSVYGIMLFIKFSIICVELCLVAFQMISSNVDIILSFLCTITVLLQSVLYCWNGQGLKDESLKISDYVYLSSKWENVGIRQRKILLLLMLRVQRACNVSGIFFVADFRLLLWVLRTAYSMVALLHTMKN